MKLARLDLSEIDNWEQMGKVIEEYTEWNILATDKGKGYTLGNDLQESIDVIQAMFGYINKIATPKQIAKALAAHESKLKRYEAIGRVPKILGWVEMKEVDK